MSRRDKLRKKDRRNKGKKAKDTTPRAMRLREFELSMPAGR